MTFSASPEIADEKIERRDPAELAGQDDRIQDRPHIASALDLVTEIVLAAHHRHTDEAFSHVIVHGYLWMANKICQTGPMCVHAL